MARGRLIVFEGPEGAGKTTQLRLLADWLTARGVRFTGVREPGQTALGNEIRRLLLEPDRAISPTAEALLFMASRAELTAEVLVPCLSAGELVLADRFFLSTYAYQVAGRGLPEREVRAANALATGGVIPDLTLLFEVPAERRRKRAELRGAPDRMEQAGDEFHARVERAFATALSPDWQIDHPECGPIVAVDGEGSQDEVFGRVLALLAERWPETFSVLDGSRQ